MAEVILMPRLSDTMTEGVIAAWHKKVGDKVKKGDLLAEIETDKAVQELESYKDGTLLHIGIEKGGKLQVNDLLAIVGAAGEDISSLIKGKTAQQKSEERQTSNVKSETSVSKQESSSKNPESKKITTASIDISKMDEVVLMPRLSDTMEEGVIAAWHKNVGDAVKKGDVLAEIETDKATMDLESYKNGTLLYIGAQKGEKIPVNGLLCVIGEKGKVDVDAIVAATKGGVSQEPGGGSPSAAKGLPTAQQESGAESSKAAAEPVKTTIQTATSSSTENGRVKASPLAKKLAKEKGVDLRSV